jgi:acyl carrier protein
MGLEMLTSARASRDLIEVMMSGRQLLQLQLKHAGWSAIAHTFFHNITTTLTLGAQEAGDRRLAPEEALDFILQTVRDITKSDDVMPGDTLASVSIDSLSLMDLTSRVKRATGVDLPVSKLKATNSIADVADLVAERMRAMQGVTEAVVTAVQESTDAVAWVGQRVEEEVQRQEERAKRRIQMVSKPSFSVFEDETRAGAIKQKQDHVDSCLRKCHGDTVGPWCAGEPCFTT